MDPSPTGRATMELLLRMTLVPAVFLFFILLAGRAADPVTSGSLCAAFLVFNAAFTAHSLPMADNAAISFECWRYALVCCVLLFMPRWIGASSGLWLLSVPAVLAAPVTLRRPGYAAAGVVIVVVSAAGGIVISEDGWLLAGTCALVCGMLGATASALYFALEKQGQVVIHAGEERRRAEQTAVELTHGIEHEVATPLHWLVDTARQLAGETLGTDQQRRADGIAQVGEAVIEALYQLRDFAQIDAGVASLTNAGFKLSEVVEAAVETADGHAARLQREAWAIIDADVPPWVHGDARRVQAVLSHLLSYAIGHASEGTRGIVTHVSRRQQGSRPYSETNLVRLRFEIRETGAGRRKSEPVESLSADLGASAVRSAEINPFSTTKEMCHVPAAGAGLMMCRGLVERMGGHVGIEIDPDLGSTLWFTIDAPLARSPEVEPLADFTGLRALVVVPDTVARDVLQHQLCAMRIAVESAESAQLAIEQLHASSQIERSFDLMVIEEEPYDDAPDPCVESIVEALRREPILADTPAVWVDGRKASSGPADARPKGPASPLLAGPSRVLHKPILPSKLSGCIEAAVRNSSGQKRAAEA